MQKINSNFGVYTMSIKLERLNTALVENISKIIHDDIKDNDVRFVTITDAKITSDLSFAKVYFTTLDEDRKKVANALNKASGFIRSKLCEKIEIRKMTEITFLYDESIEYGKKIDDIIERINKDE